MARLGVNVDHVATLREARGGKEPDPVSAAVLAEQAGADGIVIHLREDRRHVKERDLNLLRQILKIKLDLEMAPVDEVVKIALEVKPDMVTIVPERREELTTEGGLEVAGNRDSLQNTIQLLHDGGIGVSLFIEPDLNQVKASHRISADYVEIHTGRYANAKSTKEQDSEFEAIQQASKMAFKLGMGVNAGHGLNYRNIKRLLSVSEIVEYNIGHSIISHAVMVGLPQAVKEMKQLISGTSV
ncbi:MAG TPA: pyridoxine 5'-phosphate synthase [Nitrospiria bacterium]